MSQHDRLKVCSQSPLLQDQRNGNLSIKWSKLFIIAHLAVTQNPRQSTTLTPKMKVEACNGSNKLIFL